MSTLTQHVKSELAVVFGALHKAEDAVSQLAKRAIAGLHNDILAAEKEVVTVEIAVLKEVKQLLADVKIDSPKLDAILAAHAEANPPPAPDSAADNRVPAPVATAPAPVATAPAPAAAVPATS